MRHACLDLFVRFYEQMEMMRPGGGRIQIGGGGGGSKPSDKHISTQKGAMAFFNKFKRSLSPGTAPTAKSGRIGEATKKMKRKSLKKKPAYARKK